MIKVLKLLGRGAKIVGVAVGVGGWAYSMFDPGTAIIIGGAAMLAGDIIVFAGDLIDDGKLNQSFKVDP